MKKTLTLKENREFRRAYGKGKSYVSPLLVTYVCKSRLGCYRYGITTGKKIGNAVCRNRARRIIRAAYAELLPMLIEGSADIVFVARRSTPGSGSNEIKKVMERHFRQAGLLKEQNEALP